MRYIHEAEESISSRPMRTRREGRTCACLRLAVSGNLSLGNQEYILTNDLEAELTRVVLPKVSRWQVETHFPESKQHARLEACQCRMDQAMVRHVGLV